VLAVLIMVAGGGCAMCLCVMQKDQASPFEHGPKGDRPSGFDVNGGGCTVDLPDALQCSEVVLHSASPSEATALKAQQRSACGLGRGRFSEGGCPTAGRLGGCRKVDSSNGRRVATDWFYPKNKHTMTLDKMRATCSSYRKPFVPR
jgi:hypothetical protein